MKKKSILFITRKYPPKIGGMETFSYNFYKFFKINNEIKIELITGNIFKIFFLIFYFKFILRKKFDFIHLGDGAIIGLSLFFKSKISITIHGLDLIYKRFFYQTYFNFFIKNIDTFICVSQNTKRILESKKIKNKIIVIPNSINTNNQSSVGKSEKKFKNKNLKILLVGRQIKRKGTLWFLKKVVPKLPKDIDLLIIGNGVEKEKIKAEISHLKYHKIKYLENCSNQKLIRYYIDSDLFLMPNIKVNNDIEGFGIVLLEASLYNNILIGSNIDGIPSAIINNKNGHLCEVKDYNDFIDKIMLYYNNRTLLKKNKKKFSKYTKENFNNDFIFKKYLTEVFK